METVSSWTRKTNVEVAKKAGCWLLSTRDSYHRPSWWRRGEQVKEASNTPTYFLIVALPRPYSLLKHEHPNATQLSNIVRIPSAAALSTFVHSPRFEHAKELSTLSLNVIDTRFR